MKYLHIRYPTITTGGDLIADVMSPLTPSSTAFGNLDNDDDMKCTPSSTYTKTAFHIPASPTINPEGTIPVEVLISHYPPECLIMSLSCCKVKTRVF